jgi:antitoxin component of MazEF toxin-antitoxin module
MVKQLKKVGNSNAITIDRAVMELVGLDEGGSVQLTVWNGSIILTPVEPKAIDPERFEAALDRVVKGRRAVLRRLAK